MAAFGSKAPLITATANMTALIAILVIILFILFFILYMLFDEFNNRGRVFE